MQKLLTVFLNKILRNSNPSGIYRNDLFNITGLEQIFILSPKLFEASRSLFASSKNHIEQGVFLKCSDVFLLIISTEN
jgi:hypothetical protein